MQFNAVVSSNAGAGALWLRGGFEVAGRIANGYRSIDDEFSDLPIMYRALGGTSAPSAAQ